MEQEDGRIPAKNNTGVQLSAIEMTRGEEKEAGKETRTGRIDSREKKKKKKKKEGFRVNADSLNPAKVVL